MHSIEQQKGSNTILVRLLDSCGYQWPAAAITTDIFSHRQLITRKINDLESITVLQILSTPRLMRNNNPHIEDLSPHQDRLGRVVSPWRCWVWGRRVRRGCMARVWCNGDRSAYCYLVENRHDVGYTAPRGVPQYVLHVFWFW